MGLFNSFQIQMSGGSLSLAAHTMPSSRCPLAITNSVATQCTISQRLSHKYMVLGEPKMESSVRSILTFLRSSLPARLTLPNDPKMLSGTSFENVVSHLMTKSSLLKHLTVTGPVTANLRRNQALSGMWNRTMIPFYGETEI
jgi:hypothetical protein